MLVNRPKSFMAEDAGKMCEQMGNDVVAGPYIVPLQAVAGLVNKSTRDNFNSSASPEGVDWPERKNIGDGHPLLMDTGTLLQAATGGGAGHIERIDSHGLEVGVDGETVPYAAVHNDGGVNMPQREFLGLKPTAELEVEILLADFVMDEIIGEL